MRALNRRLFAGDDEALHDAEARFEHMVSQVPGMVFQLRCLDRIEFPYVSEGCLALTGLQPAEITQDGERFLALVHPEDRAGLIASLAAAGNERRAWNWQGRLVVPSQGLEKWVNLRATVQRWGDEDLWGGIALNITQAKHAEGELRRSQEMLRDLSAHHESVREEERASIAREVHDELGQTLTAIKLQLSMLAFGDSNARQGAPRPGAIEAIKSEVDEAINMVRNVVSALRPKALDLGILTAIEWLVEEFQRRSAVPCELKIPDDGKLEVDGGRAIMLFRILQESLTNIARHAGAARVSVALSWDKRAIVLSVADDGAGFDPQAARARKSFGLLGMRERALIAGGALSIESAPGAGTRLSVTIPR